MNTTIPCTLETSRSGGGAVLIRRSRNAFALIAAKLGLGILALGVGGQLLAPHAAAASGVAVQNLPVGHTIKHMVVFGSAEGERRKVDVHIWYPADVSGFSDAKQTMYTSALYGTKLLRDWGSLAELSWKVPAEIARENAPIDPSGGPFPVIVFSHGSVNDPIDYAPTLEAIAARGFVVAAPYHVNNTQDDVRIDYVNAQAGFTLLPCNDHRPPPCSRPDVAFSMADRVKDISDVLNRLPGWLDGRADVSRVGVLGHSRGTVTALAAAGGSVGWTNNVNCEPAKSNGTHGPLCWPLAANARVKAVMGLAIGGAAITDKVNFAHINVPTLLVAGGQDQNSAPSVSQSAFNHINTIDKTFILIPNAVHRSFDSNYCSEAQAAGATADTNHDGVVEPSEAAVWEQFALLNRHTLTGILTSPRSGLAVNYCSPETFTTPVDIRPLVKDLTGFEVACVTEDQATGRCLDYNVPTTGLATDAVKQDVTEQAVTFFGRVL